MRESFLKLFKWFTHLSSFHGIYVYTRPPVAVGVDASGQSVPGEVPKLFGGNVVEYLQATGSEIPLIVASCIRAIEKEGQNYSLPIFPQFSPTITGFYVSLLKEQTWGKGYTGEV